MMFLTTFQDEAAAKTAFHNLSTSNTVSGVQSVAGLGEQAFLSTQPVPALYVQKDHAILNIGVTASSSTGEENQEEQLAQFAVQNM